MKYLEIIAEIDYIHWQLSKMLKEEKKLTPIARMIDEATKYDQKKLKFANKLMKRANKLKALLKDKNV